MSNFNDLYRMAYENYVEGKFSEAQNYLNNAEEIFNPEESSITKEDIYILRGTIALSDDDYEFAQEAFEEALKKNPQSAEACMGLGQIFFAVDMKEEAKSMFEWAVKNEPENEVAVKNLEKINSFLGYPPEHNRLSEDGPAEEERDFDEIFNKAYELFLNDKFDEALEELNKFEDKYEENIFILRGNVYLAIEKDNEAKTIFENVLRNNPECTAAYNGLAQYFMNKGMPHDAKTMYEHALRINENDEFATLGLAKVNQKLGLSPTHNLVDFFSNSEVGEELNSLLDKAFGSFDQKAFEESLATLDESLQMLQSVDDEKKKEVISRILNFKGFNYLALNKTAEAKENFEASLELNPNSSQACAGLGEVFYLEGLEKEAKRMFEWGVKNNPLNAFAVAGLAKVNKTLNLPADHNLLSFGLSDDSNEKVASAVSEAYEKFVRKKYDEAINILQKAEEAIDPEPVTREEKQTLSGVLNFKGFSYLGLNDYNSARGCFENALYLNPDSSQACAGLGEVFYLIEQDSEAKTMYEWALKNEPNNKFAVAGLEKVSKVLGIEEQTEENNKEIELLISSAYDDFENKEFENAVEKLKSAEALIEERFTEEERAVTIASVSNFMGFNHLALNNKDEAKKCFEKALENNPQSSQACAGLGEIFFLNGEDEESKKMYEWAVKNNPDNRYAQGGLKKVNNVLGLGDADNSLL
ncbi:MAG: tetratricopeptide repeat protein [Chlorobi bacterium]|nr:tetratricopeptide repeat protein [Chlorobiota bacterium]